MKKLDVGQKHSKEKKLKSSKEDLRWATNELVADWRAERLKCDRISDIGCGIGLQAFSFGKKCSRVIAIDINAEKIEAAKVNAKKLNMKNITFAVGDALSEAVIQKSKESQVVFLDPQRPASADVRNLDGMKPDIKEFLTWYSDITADIAIEFPPQIHEIPLKCEREYASVNGKLNRLTLYFGGLKKCETSAVVLPAGKVLRNNDAILETADKPEQYLYEADAAVHKAGLHSELGKETNTKLLNKDKFAFFTSDNLVKSSFFRNSYKVLGNYEFDKRQLVGKLKELGVGKVLVRYEVNPKDYWTERNFYEDKLDGRLDVVLFKFDESAVICEKL